MTTNENTTVETTNLRGGGCEDGFYNCGGVCVPYPCPENPGDFENYVQLRLVLDSLETFALRYFLEGDKTTREKRAAEILGALQEALKIVNAIPPKPESPQQSSADLEVVD